MDAVFTQKNNKHATQDPSRVHPKTVFIPDTDVKLWEDFVTQVRPSKPAKESTDGDEQVDGCEGPLKGPNSVLDACEQSFTAADGSRQKASSQFF